MTELSFADIGTPASSICRREEPPQLFRSRRARPPVLQLMQVWRRVKRQISPRRRSAATKRLLSEAQCEMVPDIPYQLYE